MKFRRSTQAGTIGESRSVGIQSKLQFGGSRLISGAMPAAAMTFGLFTFMYTAIGSYDAPKEFEPLPELSRITPHVKTPIESSTYEPALPIEASAPPPRPAPYEIDQVEAFIPQTHDFGRVPERIEYGQLLPTHMRSVTRQKQLQPISGPAAVYPDRLLERGIQGSCEVRFNVSVRGEPYNIRPDCTHPGFASSAKRAVSASRFSPEIIDGQPVERSNVVYPITYNLAE